jgi:hypothetical protein
MPAHASKGNEPDRAAVGDHRSNIGFGTSNCCALELSVEDHVERIDGKWLLKVSSHL